MASTDATAIPVKNQAFRVTFPLFDADGDLVTGAAGLDSEVSKDGGTFADCTNEATEIATSSGFYYLDLTATEMNADTVAVIVKTSTTGAKTTPIVLYPQEAGDIKVNVTYWNGTAVTAPNTAGTPIVDVTRWLGTTVATPNTAGIPKSDATLIEGTDATNQLDTAVALGVTNLASAHGAGSWTSDTTDLAAAIWDALASGHNTAGTLGALLNTAAGIAPGATAAQIWDYLVANAITSGSMGKFLSDRLDAVMSSRATDTGVWAAATRTITGGTVTTNSDKTGYSIGAGGIANTAFAAGAIDAAAIATDAIGSAELAASAVTELQSGLATSAALVTAQADLDDIQTRLPAALVAGRIDASVGAMAANTVTAAAAAADLTTELQSGLATAAALATAQTAVTDIQSRLPAALVSGRIDASVGAMAANTMTAAAAAADLATELQTGMATAAGLTAATANLDVAVSTRATAAAQTSMAASLADLDTRLPAALVAGRIVADAVAISGSSGAADAVEANVGNLDVPVSSRSVFAGGAVASVTGPVGSVTGNVGGSVDSVVTGVTVATVADKTGYALSGAGVDAIWDEPIPEPAGVFDWASATARKIVAWSGVMNKNKKVQTSALLTIRNDADSAALGTATATDSGGVATKGKVT